MLYVLRAGYSESYVPFMAQRKLCAKGREQLMLYVLRAGYIESYVLRAGNS